MHNFNVGPSAAAIFGIPSSHLTGPLSEDDIRLGLSLPTRDCLYFINVTSRHECHTLPRIGGAVTQPLSEVVQYEWRRETNEKGD